MKKWRIVLLSAIIIIMISGCGNTEPVDMEAFRCQDSIETVFEVLGETELQNEWSFLHSYEYEKVNLWGYKGTAIFHVRDDKETIQYFEAEMMLTDKESLELLSFFFDKYGTVEMETLKNGDKEYCWQLQTSERKIGHEDGELGFDKITITIEDSYSEEAKHEIIFRDKWSTASDEAYYEALEESQNPQIETSEVLVEKEYDICGDDVRLLIVSKDEEYEFMCYGTARNKSNANILTMMLYTICEKMKEESYEYSIMVSYDNGGCIVLGWDGDSYITVGINEDGSATFSKPDWFEGEDTMSESELNEYAEVLTNAFKDTVSELQE